MLSVIIPCFNEKASLLRYEGDLLAELDRLQRDYEVILVDDGSTDGSAEVMAELLRSHPRIHLARHPSNLGLGFALRTGFAKARGSWLVCLDADLTFNPRQIQILLRRQQETSADLVSGSPYLTSEGMETVPWIRRLPSLLINALYRGLFEPSVTSYTPMFRLYNATAVKNMPLASKGFEINAEIAVRFWLAQRKIAEAPVILESRREGVSKLDRWRELKRHLSLILRLLREAKGPVSPR